MKTPISASVFRAPFGRTIFRGQNVRRLILRENYRRKIPDPGREICPPEIGVPGTLFF
jgi:hypothetical protein